MADIDSRQERLLAFIAGKGYVSLQEMTEAAQVSESTVRRDLTNLEEQGLVRRTRGGAVLVSDGPHALAFAKRETTHVVEKQAIARVAGDLIRDGETVIVNGGTTTYELAKLMVGHNLQIVTNSLPIASLFSNRLDAELIMIAGYLYPRTGVTVGPLAVSTLEKIHANKVFMGAAGIQSEGLFNVNMPMVEVERKMLQCADQVIVLADHSKFGRRALTHMAQLREIDTFISDSALAEEHRSMLKENEVELLIAEVPEEQMETGA